MKLETIYEYTISGNIYMCICRIRADMKLYSMSKTSSNIFSNYLQI